MPELTDESENAEIYARYLGEGARYLAGIPARDLTRAEWDALSEQDRDRARDVKPALYAFAVTNDDPTASVEGDFGFIDLRDGANDAEAKVASRTLNARRKEK